MHIIFQKGLDAAKKNAGPGFILQGFALAMVLLYYFHPPTHQLLLKIPEIKQRMGVFFPILAAAFFGGLIPFIFLITRKEVARGRFLANLLFMLGFWGLNGLIVDCFYKVQANLFGDHPDVVTVIKKVCFDQFVYNPVWAVPWSVSAYTGSSATFHSEPPRHAFPRPCSPATCPPSCWQPGRSGYRRSPLSTACRWRYSFLWSVLCRASGRLCWWR